MDSWGCPSPRAYAVQWERVSVELDEVAARAKTHRCLRLYGRSPD